MLDRLKQWNDRQRDAAQQRLADLDAKRTGQKAAQQERYDELRAKLPDSPFPPAAETMKAWVKANRQARIAELAGVHVFPDRIIRMQPWPGQHGEEYPIAGVQASVDQEGGLSGRATLTRTAVPGAHGWQKKVDTRETWLVVDGPDFQWSVQVPQPNAGQARGFAAAITTAGRRAAAGSS